MISIGYFVLLATFLSQTEAIYQKAGPRRIVVQFKKSEFKANDTALQDRWLAIKKNADHVSLGDVKDISGSQATKVIWSRSKNGTNQDLIALKRTDGNFTKHSDDKLDRYTTSPRGELIIPGPGFADSKHTYSLDLYQASGLRRPLQRYRLLVIDGLLISESVLDCERVA